MVHCFAKVLLQSMQIYNETSKNCSFLAKVYEAQLFPPTYNSSLAGTHIFTLHLTALTYINFLLAFSNL